MNVYTENVNIVYYVSCIDFLFGSENVKKRKTIKKNRILRVLLVAFILYSGYFLAVQQFDIIRLSKIKTEAIKKNNEIVYQNEHLSKLLKDTNTDKFAEKMAREKLGLIKNGEMVYIDKNSKE